MSVAPGWYTDPHDEARIRYWDGSIWTEQSAGRGARPDDGSVPSGSEAATGVLPAQGGGEAGVPDGHAQAGAFGGQQAGAGYGAGSPTAGSPGAAAGYGPAGAYGGQQAGAGYGAGSPTAGSPGAAAGYGPAGAYGGQQAGAGYGAGSPTAGSPGAAPGYGPAGAYGGQQAAAGYGAGAPGGLGGPGGYGPGGPGEPGGPGGPANGGSDGNRRSPALIALLAILGVAIVGVGGYFVWDAVAGEDDTASETTAPPSDAQPSTPGPTTEPASSEAPTTEEPTTEEPTTEEPTTEEPTTEEPTTEEPSVAPGEFVGNDESGAAVFVDPDGEGLGTRFESAIDADGAATVTLRVDERAAVIIGGHSPDGEDLRFQITGEGVDETLDDSQSLMPVFGFRQEHLDPADARVLDPGDYQITIDEYGGDPSQIIMEAHSGTLVVGVPSDTPVTIEDGRPSVFILHVGAETPLRAGVHGDEDTMIHVVDPELFVHENDDAPPEHEPRNPLDASVDIESVPVGDSVIVASTFWGDATDAVVHIEPR
ncbi:DUF2510 domain-containing protein [Georgenia sp. Z1344]|uniref:DUF2510 domain-containing protein n=1 Tax=Georgenia sp. Z1344 TaxID=3416706 RepID=UPI003CE7389D